jgi:hypothetical protein
MLATVWAVVKEGKIELLEQMSLPEGARLLVTVVPAEEEADLQQSLEAENAEVRQAYPLMDAVARQEGWDDPEMDSYNIYARKPQQ